MDYLSFDLRLGEWNPTQRTGVAEVLQSPAGESERYDFELDLDIEMQEAEVVPEEAEVEETEAEEMVQDTEE